MRQCSQLLFVSLLCELLAIVVKFMPSSTILLSVSTSENLAGAQGDVPKSGSSLSRRSLYYMHVETTACNGQVGPTLTFEWVKPPPAGSCALPANVTVNDCSWSYPWCC